MKLKTITLISSLFAISIATTATIHTSVANGSWSSSTTWSPAGVPAQNDTIILASPYKVTSTSDITIGTSTGGKITINDGANLDMGSHQFSLGHNASLINNGTLSISTLELDDASSLTNAGTLTAHTGIELNTSKSFTNSGTLTTGSFSLDDNSTFTNTGSVTATTVETNSTSTFTDNGSMTVSTSIEIDASSTFIVGAGVTLNDGGAFDDNSSTGITDNGAILVSGTATFYGGSSISGSGYLTGNVISDFHNTTVWGVPSSYFPCHTCTIPTVGLPIQLVSFSAANSNDAVQLEWTTASEIDNNYFTLSRSTDGTDFTVIDNVKGSGKSSAAHSYTYTDLGAETGTNYYKLQQTDYDGTITTVGIAVANVTSLATHAEVFPNPVKNNCFVAFTDAVQENMQVTVYDYMGREVATMNVQTNKGKNVIELNTSALAAGMYFVTIPVNGSSLKARFVK